MTTSTIWLPVDHNTCPPWINNWTSYCGSSSKGSYSAGEDPEGCLRGAHFWSNKPKNMYRITYYVTYISVTLYWHNQDKSHYSIKWFNSCMCHESRLENLLMILSKPTQPLSRKQFLDLKYNDLWCYRPISRPKNLNFYA